MCVWVCVWVHMHGTAHVWIANLHSCRLTSIKPKQLAKSVLSIRKLKAYLS